MLLTDDANLEERVRRQPQYESNQKFWDNAHDVIVARLSREQRRWGELREYQDYG